MENVGKKRKGEEKIGVKNEEQGEGISKSGGNEGGVGKRKKEKRCRMKQGKGKEKRKKYE